MLPFGGGLCPLERWGGGSGCARIGAMSDLVTLEVDDRGIAALTLNRPDTGNAFNHDLALARAEQTRRLTRERGSVR